MGGSEHSSIDLTKKDEKAEAELTKELEGAAPGAAQEPVTVPNAPVSEPEAETTTPTPPAAG